MADTKTNDAAEVTDANAALLARLDAMEAELTALRAQKATTPAASDTPAKPKARRIEKTGDNTHRANQRGYALGQLIEEGDLVPAGIPVSDVWMDEIDAKGRKLARAVAEAQDESPKDVDLTQVGVPGLKAMAAERGINPKGLSESDLIAAIRAEREPTI